MKHCKYVYVGVGYLFLCQPSLGVRVEAPRPCVFDGTESDHCRVSIESDVRTIKDSSRLELVVTTKNRSAIPVFVVESDPRYDVSVSVKDVWGNVLPFTESEKYHQSHFRVFRNFLLELKPSEETTMELPLSSMFVFAQPGEYQVIVRRDILKDDSVIGVNSYAQILERSQSKPLRFVLGKNGLRSVQLPDGSWRDVPDSATENVRE